MSMRDYAVDEYGLLLDEKTMKALAKKMCKDYLANYLPNFDYRSRIKHLVGTYFG